MPSLPILDPLAPTAALDPARFLREEYAEAGRPGLATRSYYRLKPLIPRSLQLRMRRAYARRQAQRAFPRWPVEPLLVEHLEGRLRAEIEAHGGPLEMVWLWPHGRRFAITLTHDVEGPAGVANIERLLAIERRHGFVSSWNFCGEGYRIPDGLFDWIRASGGEVALHGITHDDIMWRDRGRFERQLPAIHRYLEAWDAVGFRSPATHRNAAWMPELGALYDSSFPDTDPFEPKAGGCCSIWPFFLDDMVELPITLVQDHTLWEILRTRSIDPWVEKSEWIAEHHGLVNLILHPDYAVDQERLDLYEALLEHFIAMEGAWHALPRDVAGWWRDRATYGLHAPGATRALVHAAGAGVQFEPAPVEARS